MKKAQSTKTVMPLGTLIDGLYSAREKRLELARQVDALKEEERGIKTLIMERLADMKSSKAAGQFATASISTKTEPLVEDWKKAYKYIHDKKAYHLLHQRIASRAWAELHDAGVTVPGIAAVAVKDLSLTKLTKG